MKIARIYDDNGQSRFTNIDIALNPTRGVAGLRASAPFSAGQCLFFSPPPRATSQPHVAPQRQLVVIVSGELEIEAGDGEKRRFRPGDILLADDTTGSGHISRMFGDETVALFVPVADIPE